MTSEHKGHVPQLCFTHQRVSDVGDAAKLEACLPGYHIPVMLYKALQCPSLILELHLFICRASNDRIVSFQNTGAAVLLMDRPTRTECRSLP